MNKKLLTTLFIIGALFTSNTYADTVTTTNTSSSATTKENIATMRTQLNAIQSKLNSISTMHRTNIDN